MEVGSAEMEIGVLEEWTMIRFWDARRREVRVKVRVEVCIVIGWCPACEGW